MCGIVGAFSYQRTASTPSREELLRARDCMLTRGPDDQGYWSHSTHPVQFGHRRLAVLDLSPRGHQPMRLEGSTATVVYNGEVYNFLELRTELEARGYTFNSDSDTEVIIRLYDEFGVEGFTRLRGMFAIALWDDARNELILHRDRFGIKPLYYTLVEGTCYFSSQVRSLLQFSAVDRTVEQEAISSFLLLGSVAEPFTILVDTFMLPAGALARISEARGVTIEPLVSTFPEPSRQEVSAAVEDSVNKHLLSDAPCGFFLSAGIDSSILVAAAAREQSRSLHTVTLGFEQLRGTENDETVLAEATAKLFNTSHQTIWIPASDTCQLLATLFSAMDQPSIDGMNSLLVSKAAHEAGLTVALSGLGGDELFSGYPSFSQIPRLLSLGSWINWIPGIGTFSRECISRVLPCRVSPKSAGIIEYSTSVNRAYLLRRGLFMPWELSSHSNPHASISESNSTTLQSLFSWQGWPLGSELNRQIAALEFCWYMRNQLLRDTDWASMAYSLEVRVPFVDQLVVAASIGKAHSKAELIATLGAKLPEAVRRRKKTGFVVPLREWLSESEPSLSSMRGLRGWALFVLQRYCEINSLRIPQSSAVTSLLQGVKQ